MCVHENLCELMCTTCAGTHGGHKRGGEVLGTNPRPFKSSEYQAISSASHFFLYLDCAQVVCWSVSASFASEKCAFFLVFHFWFTHPITLYFPVKPFHPIEILNMQKSISITYNWSLSCLVLFSSQQQNFVFTPVSIPNSKISYIGTPFFLFFLLELSLS